MKIYREICDLCQKLGSYPEQNCGHNCCDECKQEYDSICVQCGLRLNLIDLLEDPCTHKNSSSSTDSSIDKNYQDFTLTFTQPKSLRSSLGEERNTQPKPTSLNLNLLQPIDQLRMHQHGCEIRRSHSTRSNTSIGESEMSMASCHTATSNEEKRFVCHFHSLDIVSKHFTKNKFYCDSCQVNPEYVQEYNQTILVDDLTYLHEYIARENIKIDFDLKKVLKLNQIYSKTVMVLNLKIEEARGNHAIFIPYTDGKGPISKFNLRRIRQDKLRKLFGSLRAEDNKMHKFINDLCREYKVGPKSKMLDLTVSKEMLKNCTDSQETVFESLQCNSIEGKVDMNTFKDNLKIIIKNHYEL